MKLLEKEEKLVERPQGENSEVLPLFVKPTPAIS